jgi:hypothetical protein
VCNQAVLVDPQFDGGHVGLAQGLSGGEPESAAGQAASPPSRRDAIDHLNDSVTAVAWADDADEWRLFGDGDHEYLAVSAGAARPAVEPVVDRLLGRDERNAG